MGQRLAGKTAIVTGASSGIGLAAARLFAAEGATVALAARHLEPLQNAAAAIVAETGNDNLLVIPTDASSEEAVAAMVRAAVERWGKVDCIFNAAGISGRRFGDGPAADCTLDGWNTVLSSNLTSMFLCTKYALQAMLPHASGSIVNLASVLGMVGGDEHFGTHAYAASKGGIIAFTRAVASYYADRGIRANVIAPGLIRTNMSLRAQSDDDIIAALPRLQPLTGDFGAAEDVAQAALYLASDESRFVTGIVLPVDGGWTVR
ncbi:MAG TPA: SDR family NAD(P)-dependent oxidoreductase [Thermomicrobiales bacterium]|nr:SDR family NAD(P)-dependent oxidoreductase [Thermomicrobiales bacterium]